MDQKSKDILLSLVLAAVSEDPEIVVDLYATIQQGIRERMQLEMHERSELAAGFSVLWDFPNGKKKYRNQIINGAKALARFYRGTPFAEAVEAWIKGE